MKQILLIYFFIFIDGLSVGFIIFSVFWPYFIYSIGRLQLLNSLTTCYIHIECAATGVRSFSFYNRFKNSPFCQKLKLFVLSQGHFQQQKVEKNRTGTPTKTRYLPPNQLPLTLWSDITNAPVACTCHNSELMWRSIKCVLRRPPAAVISVCEYVESSY